MRATVLVLQPLRMLGQLWKKPLAQCRGDMPCHCINVCSGRCKYTSETLFDSHVCTQVLARLVVSSAGAAWKRLPEKQGTSTLTLAQTTWLKFETNPFCCIVLEDLQVKEANLASSVQRQ
eukprot:403472-Amphidinium_carterae.1